MSEAQAEVTGSAPIDIKGFYTPYEHSFGVLPDKTVYSDPQMEIDMYSELKDLVVGGMKEAQLKAGLTTTSGGVGTAGHALVPVYVDARIVDRSRKFTPWTAIVPRVTNLGKEADFNVLTDKEDGYSAGEGAPAIISTDTEDRESTSIKYIYSNGQVTGQAQAAIPPYILQGGDVLGTGTTSATFVNTPAPNGMQYEILKRSRALKEFEEQLLWAGDASTTATDFSGIVKLQSTTNQNDKSTTALTIDDMEQGPLDSYDDSGRAAIIGCDSKSLKDIRKLYFDHFRMSPSEMKGVAALGIPASLVIETAIGSMPVLPSQFLTNTSGAKQVFFLDMEYIEMRVLQDMTFKRLGENDDSSRFMLKEYLALLLRGPQFNAFVDNIL